MDKTQMAKYIKSNYSGLLQKILLAQLDYLKNGKAYRFSFNGTSYKLTNNKGSFEIREA